jgi:hypothetical protein
VFFTLEQSGRKNPSFVIQEGLQRKKGLYDRAREAEEEECFQRQPPNGAGRSRNRPPDCSRRQAGAGAGQSSGAAGLCPRPAQAPECRREQAGPTSSRAS